MVIPLILFLSIKAIKIGSQLSPFPEVSRTPNLGGRAPRFTIFTETGKAPSSINGIPRAFVVPGMGTTSSPWARSQARATWEVVAPTPLPISVSFSTKARLAVKFSPWNRG